MAAALDAIWALDLGNNSLKALHLMAVGDVVQVIGFDHIPHGKILSSSGVSAAEKEELIAITLRQFVQRNDVGYDPLIVSVPSQNSFARFVTLPPVEQKRLPEIVRFEAAQQIPFDMSEVQWDYQLMTAADSPEKKVGIFAIKNEVVESALEHFEREDLQVSYVQMAPMALYNYLLYDRPDLIRSDSRATVIINVGADSTDLVVCTESGVWQRCIMMGGNTFTQAIAETFKLNFAKAEKLKRTAPVSKYARQIFQAMRPVFTDWAGEVQRSLGFYSSSNANVKLTRVVAIGGGTKLRGLLKYLQQTLQIPVEKPDMYKRLAIAQGLSTAKFHENVADFGVVYGLGLQGLGMARIESNLLPKSVARSMAWAGKTKYFIGAAVLLLMTSLMYLGRVGLDQISYARGESIRAMTRSAVARADKAIQAVGDIQGQESGFQERMKKEFEYFKYREMIPELYDIILSALPNAKNNDEQQALYEAFAAGDIARVMAIPRKERKQLFVTQVSIYYSDDLATAQFGRTATMRKDSMMRTAEGGDETPMYDEEMMAQLEAIYGDRMSGGAFGAAGGETEAKEKGFVISIVGYSPYKDIGALLDPVGVEKDRKRWGFITRLGRLNEFLDVNSPLELYSKEAGQFELEKGEVDLEKDIPLGVGVTEIIPDEGDAKAGPAVPNPMGGMSSLTGTAVLVDPMTRERISAEPMMDQYGKPRVDQLGNPVLEIRDYWFSANFKLKWRNAPETPASAKSKAAGAR